MMIRYGNFLLFFGILIISLAFSTGLSTPAISMPGALDGLDSDISASMPEILPEVKPAKTRKAEKVSIGIVSVNQGYSLNHGLGGCNG